MISSNVFYFDSARLYGDTKGVLVVVEVSTEEVRSWFFLGILRIDNGESSLIVVRFDADVPIDVPSLKSPTNSASSEHAEE
jgi:hypothetical protein